MSYQDDVHNAATCSSATCPCQEWSQRDERAAALRANAKSFEERWAAEYGPKQDSDEAILNDVDEVLMGLSPFAAAWASAPESMRRYCEEDVARWFFNQGWIDGHKVATVDMEEMNRLLREKGLA